ncbi:MAG: hypothetical protein WAV93_13655 [Bacteroidales bacterium]
MHLADATGDAVIISAGADVEMVFTRKAPGDGFLISTNFNVANPSNGFSYPCWRYDLAGELPGKLLAGEALVTSLEIAGVMDAVHVSSSSGWTIKTMVAEMVNGIVYFYFFYQYDRPLVLNVRQELANPRAPGPLSMLCPQDVRDEATRRYNKRPAEQCCRQGCRHFMPCTYGFKPDPALCSLYRARERPEVLVARSDRTWSGCPDNQVLCQKKVQERNLQDSPDRDSG